MLGKTNITTVQKGTIVSEIEDYGWTGTSVSGINQSFIKVISANNSIVAITNDGTIAYTKDGENWVSQRLDLEDEYELTDVIWDGSKFIFVGSHTFSYTSADETVSFDRYSGLIVESEDLVNFIIHTKCTGSAYAYEDEDTPSYTSNENLDRACRGRFLGIIINTDGTYTIFTAIETNYKSSGNEYIYIVRGKIGAMNVTSVIASINLVREISRKVYLSIAKSSNLAVFYLRYYTHSASVSGGSWHVIVGTVSTGYDFQKIYSSDMKNILDTYSVFECKDTVYCMSHYADYENYSLTKFINDSENIVLTKGVNYGFNDSLYYNKCELFLSDHHILIVKPGENIADKTIEDFTEITYDFSLDFMVKAFDKIYIFGTGGNILISSAEIKNEESISVKAMSAMKALYDAKAYTDTKYAELENRVIALEAYHNVTG